MTGKNISLDEKNLFLADRRCVLTEKRQGSCLGLGVKGKKARNKRLNPFFFPEVKLLTFK